MASFCIGIFIGSVHNSALHGRNRLPEAGGSGKEYVCNRESGDGDGG